MKNETETKLRAWSRPWREGVDLQLRVYGPGTVAVGEPITLRTVKPEEDGMPLRPTLSLSTDQAQLLMDDLWNCGLRPSEGSGSAGQLASVQRHLEDMRVIVFDKLNVAMPPK